MEYPNRIITTGEKDAAVVKQIQTRLNQMGYGLSFIDGIFDQTTIKAVKAYQQNHLDQNGNPLITDGEVGPRTWMCLFYNFLPKEMPSSPLLIELLKIARKEIGVQEDPPYSNRGARVEEYLKSVNLVPGNPWCAAFVYWCFQQASISLNRANPLPRTGSCMNHWYITKGEKLTSLTAFLNPDDIKPGDVFIINRQGGKGHTGIVTGVCNGYIYTIEGNSNAFHSAEGYEVIELQRRIDSISAGFIRYK
jgi:hypothetical protein